MKRTLAILFLLPSVCCAPAGAQQPCPDNPCPTVITKIGDCPNEGCRQSAFDPNHPYDPELNKRKHAFLDRATAAVWLGVPEEILKLEDKPGPPD